MTHHHEPCSTAFDSDFNEIPELRWLPWVGRRFSKRPQDARLLIVGESHYEENNTKYGQDPNFTRRVVSDHAITLRLRCRARMWQNLDRMLFGTVEYNRTRFWNDVAFYNFIQRPMKNQKERPTWQDCVSGWSTFAQVVRVLNPSHALHLGVGRFNSFNDSIDEQNADFTRVQCTEQIIRDYGRKASISAGSETVALIGIRHPGSYFSWGCWRDYLGRHHKDLSALIDAAGYTTEPQPWQQ